MKLIMPVVDLKNIFLRDIQIDDYLDYYDLGRDFETTKYLTWGPFLQPNEAIWIIENINMKRPLDGLPVGYVIVDKKSKKMIGTIDFHTYYQSSNTAEIGFCLHKNYWGRGIMTKCLKAVVTLGFEYLNLDRIVVGHVIDNQASRNVILKCGFKYDKTVYGAFLTKDTKEKKDIIYYCYYKFEYERGM